MVDPKGALEYFNEVSVSHVLHINLATAVPVFSLSYRWAFAGTDLMLACHWATR
jgi:hypothetical protein